jgi:hypothetical protein
MKPRGMIPEEENVALKAENARLLEQMKTVDALGEEPGLTHETQLSN